MEINIKSLILIISILTTGLSAGLFYAFSVSVIPGLANVSHRTYLEAMQSINRAILNWAFFATFAGSIFLLMASAYMQFRIGVNLTFWLMFAACIFYVIGTIGVTAIGNVPMNEGLAALDLTAIGEDELKITRLSYEGKWNQLHSIRTVFSLLAFLAILLAGILGDKLSSVLN